MLEKYQEDHVKEFPYVSGPDGVKVVGYCGVKDHVQIPSSIEGEPVVELGVSPYDYVRHVPYDVLIPPTVKHVDVRCVNPPPSSGWSRSPGRSARRSAGWFDKFSLAPGNPNLSFVDHLLIEGGKTVLYCTDYEAKQIQVPDGIEHIGAYAFMDCAELEEVLLPDGLRSIGEHAFDGCKISRVTLPMGLESIGYAAFSNYLALYGDCSVFELPIPPSVKELSVSDGMCPAGLEQNENLTVCDGFLMTADKKTIFWYLGAPTTELIIPDQVETIAPYACAVPALSDLKKLTLGPSLKTVCTHAFGKNKVKTLKIPAHLETLEDWAFDFSSISSVTVDKKNPRFYTDKTAFYRVQEDGTLVLVHCFRNKIEAYTVADNTVQIEDGAFLFCPELKDLTLPDSLLAFTAGNIGFGMEKIHIPRSVQQITFPMQDSRIEYEFDPENASYFWEDHVLYKRAEDGLVALRIDGDTDEISLKPGTISIAPHAFCKKIKKVVFPDSVKRVEHHAFYFCKLEEVVLNEGLETIGYLAFGINRIKHVALPSSIQYISVFAFESCPLQAYTVAGGNQFYAVRDDALYSKDMTVLYDVPAQKDSAEFSVAENTTDICQAFRRCGKIEAIKLPSGVRNIWSFAMTDCSALKDVYFEESPDWISLSSLDYDRPLTLHAEPGTPVARLVEELKAQAPGKIKVSLA